MEGLLQLMFLQSLINAGVHMLCNKWKISDWYNFHHARWMPHECSLCFMWWLCLLEYILFDVWFGHMAFGFIEIIIYAFCATILSLFFFNRSR